MRSSLIGRRVGQETKKAGRTGGEDGDWLMVLRVQDVIQSGNEDEKEMPGGRERTMHHDFVKGVKYKFLSCKWTKKKQKMEDVCSLNKAAVITF